MLQRGFTLIELLVVMAIIGILVSIIIPRLQDARTEGVEARVMSELEAVGKRAVIEESQALTYDVVCGSNSFVQAASISDIISRLEAFASTTVTCNSDTEAFALSVPLSSSTHWCIDSDGNHLSTSSALGAGILSCL